ncbi:MAG: hypothetical protein ABIJ08_04995, partial [Nanoarchaeota archaeon]
LLLCRLNDSTTCEIGANGQPYKVITNGSNSWFHPGKFGSAFAQNASAFAGMYYDASFLNTSGLQQAFTIEFWVGDFNNNGVNEWTDSTEEHILTIGSGTWNDHIISCMSHNSNQLYCRRYNDSTYGATSYIPSSVVSDWDINTWYHVAWTWNSTQGVMLIYLNGILMDTDYVSPALFQEGFLENPTWNVPLLYISGGTASNGDLSVDDVRILNYTLSQAQIEKNSGHEYQTNIGKYYDDWTYYSWAFSAYRHFEDDIVYNIRLKEAQYNNSEIHPLVMNEWGRPYFRDYEDTLRWANTIEYASTLIWLAKNNISAVYWGGFASCSNTPHDMTMIFVPCVWNDDNHRLNGIAWAYALFYNYTYPTILNAEISNPTMFTNTMLTTTIENKMNIYTDNPYLLTLSTYNESNSRMSIIIVNRNLTQKEVFKLNLSDKYISGNTYNWVNISRKSDSHEYWDGEDFSFTRTTFTSNGTTWFTATVDPLSINVFEFESSDIEDYLVTVSNNNSKVITITNENINNQSYWLNFSTYTGDCEVRVFQTPEESTWLNSKEIDDYACEDGIWNANLTNLKSGINYVSQDSLINGTNWWVFSPSAYSLSSSSCSNSVKFGSTTILAEGSSNTLYNQSNMIVTYTRGTLNISFSLNGIFVSCYISSNNETEKHYLLQTNEIFPDSSGGWESTRFIQVNESSEYENITFVNENRAYYLNLTDYTWFGNGNGWYAPDNSYHEKLFPIDNLNWPLAIFANITQNYWYVTATNSTSSKIRYGNTNNIDTGLLNANTSPM